MRLLCLLTAAAAAATILAAPSFAGLPPSARTLMEHRETLTPSRHLLLAQQTVKHARDVLGFLREYPDVGTPQSRWKVHRASSWLLRFGLAERGKARSELRSYVPRVAETDWLSAVAVVQRWFPGSSGWLISCSSGEGGHGGFVYFGHLSYPKYGSHTTPGGWMQFMQDTFWNEFQNARAYLRTRGVALPASSASWFSPLGQAVAGAYALLRGHTGAWTGSGC